MSPELSFAAPPDERWMRGQTIADFEGAAPIWFHDQAEALAPIRRLVEPPPITDPALGCQVCGIPRSEYEGHWCGPEWRGWT